MGPDSEIARQPEDSKAYIRIFDQRRERQKRATWLAMIVMFLPICILLWLRARQVVFDPESFGIVVIAAVAPLFLSLLGLLWFTQLNWRCPACNRFLRILHPLWTPDSLFCPYCGTKLR